MFIYHCNQLSEANLTITQTSLEPGFKPPILSTLHPCYSKVQYHHLKSVSHLNLEQQSKFSRTYSLAKGFLNLSIFVMC